MFTFLKVMCVVLLFPLANPDLVFIELFAHGFLHFLNRYMHLYTEHIFMDWQWDTNFFLSFKLGAFKDSRKKKIEVVQENYLGH